MEEITPPTEATQLTLTTGVVVGGETIEGADDSRNVVGNSTAKQSALGDMALRAAAASTNAELQSFLQWQLGRRGDGEEQKRFREDAMLYPKLLVFAVMRKKSPFIHLVHSAGVYPKIPGADPDWQGKSIGFLGDRTQFASPHMVELGKTTAWGWEEIMLPTDSYPMERFYDAVENRLKFWMPEATAPHTRRACPRMLALPPECVSFCAEERRTPAELWSEVQNIIRTRGVDPAPFDLLLDWCSMASLAGTGTNSTSSVLSVAMPAVIGATDHLQEWAHNRLEISLGPARAPPASEDTPTQRSGQQGHGNDQRQGSLDVGVLAQVTAAVVAAFRTGNGEPMPAVDPQRSGQRNEDTRQYSEFQLAKLKGFCCMRTNANLPVIWEYFKSTKDVDAQRTQLQSAMKEWARQHDVQINRGVYFDKATMDEIVRMEFCPGTPTAYLATAEQGISILVCRPRAGNETADIRSREQAVQATAKNHTLAEALLLGRRDPRPPAANYHELKLDVGTFCALLWVLFGERCDYFDNCYALLNMLDSESVFANAVSFTPLICRQITWAIINDSRQYFFNTVTADQLASGAVRWPTSLLMQIIGADVHAGREIRMGNFPSKWSEQATVGAYAVPPDRGNQHRNSPKTTTPAGWPPGYQQTSPPAPWPAPTPTPTRSQAPAPDRPVQIRQTDIHPTLKSFMSRYITHFRSVQWKTLMQASQVSEGDLPTLPKYMKDGRNGLCYAYVLGKCQGRICGRYPEGHAPATDISDEFAQALCRALATGVEHRLATEPPNSQVHFTRNPGSATSKRYKRTA
jgi:hypothetical protein